MAAVQNKRKRESQDIAGGRAAPVMNSQEFENHYLQTDDDGMNNADGVMDFSPALAALVQRGGDHDDAEHDSAQLPVQGGDGSGQSASDTAAAAMAQYHTMTVPQSTEQSFMTQTEGGDRQNSTSAEQGGSNAQHRHSSFGDFDTSAAQLSPNGETSPVAGGASGGSKPAVGSEEWHKVRKDNHKEGMSTCCMN